MSRALRVLIVAMLLAIGLVAPASADQGPPLSTPQQQLDDALDCGPFDHPDRDSVLLVHGTFTYAQEQWNLTFRRLLTDQGFDVCVVSYPDRGLGDIQVSSEYVVNAIRRMRERTGRDVDVVGHSQGGLEPRWAIKWWPDVRADVDDYVGLASPNHGGSSDALRAVTVVKPSSIWQMSGGSRFLGALNAGDETPGSVSYTSIYSQFDELIQPTAPVPTAALSWGQADNHVANILVQDICPGRLTDHLAIGLWDRVTFALLLDALSHPGPASPARAGGSVLCGLPLLPDPVVDPNLAGDLLGVIPTEPAHLPRGIHLTTTEPPLASYAREGSA
jgi:triacylglycerol lipase